jgi:hypothetical protein
MRLVRNVRQNLTVITLLMLSFGLTACAGQTLTPASTPSPPPLPPL